MTNQKIEDITQKYTKLPWMTYDQAIYVRKIILENNLNKLCELGHLHGKSSIYLASILEEQGHGHLWTFDITLNKSVPNINTLLDEFNLKDYVTPIVSDEGFIWDLSDIVRYKKQTFDFCYIDGGHSFNNTGMAFILMDKLLEKDSIVIFDDYYWCVHAAGDAILNAPIYKIMTSFQRKTPQVKMVCDVLVSKDRYELLELNEKFGWAVYRKIV